MHIVLGEFWKREKGSGGCRLPVGSRVVGSFIMPCGGCFFCVKVYSSSKLFPLLYLTICHHLQSSLKYYKSSSCFQDQLNALMPLSENRACPYCIDLHARAHAIVWNYGVCPIMLYWLVCILLWGGIGTRGFMWNIFQVQPWHGGSVWWHNPTLLV